MNVEMKVKVKRQQDGHVQTEAFIFISRKGSLPPGRIPSMPHDHLDSQLSEPRIMLQVGKNQGFLL